MAQCWDYVYRPPVNGPVIFRDGVHVLSVLETAEPETWPCTEPYVAMTSEDYEALLNSTGTEFMTDEQFEILILTIIICSMCICCVIGIASHQSSAS